MKTVLLPVHPNWLKLILSGKKTVEVRKTKPKEAVPFRVLLYCTKGPIELARDKSGNIVLLSRNKKADISDLEILSGKVIAEFVCEDIDRMAHCGTCQKDIRLKIKHNLNCEEIERGYLTKCQLSYDSLEKYSGGGDLYGWYISDLKIYNKPKELSEFYKKCNEGCEDCYLWQNVRVNSEEFDMDCSSKYYGHIPLKRPPQSWCYVRCEE